MEHRIGDLQVLAKAIINKTGRNPLSHPNHSTTQRLTQLANNSLQHERRQFGITADNVINILCKADPPDTEIEGRQTASATDYLGYPIGKPECSGVDTWGHLNRSESGWGNWFGIIAQVCKSWHEAAQKQRRNPSHITIHDWHSDLENWATYGGRILREIKTSYKTYTKLHSIYVGYGAIQSKTQAHELINILCDLTPTLKKLHMPNTTTGIGLRAAKTLAMRGLGLRDSIQFVTWLHGLPITGAKDFLTLIQDSPRATVVHILEGCEQIALLNLVTQGYLPENPLQGFGGHPIGKQLLPFVLIFERELFPRLTYMQNLIKHINDCSTDILRTTKNIITYDSLPDSGNGALPRQRPYSTNPHLRPTVKRGIFDNPYAHLPGEQPCKDLEHDEFGYDEERGLSKILLEQGTEIEIPIEDELGVISWTAGIISSYQVGSLDFRAEFLGNTLDTGTWRQTRSRADMDVTWHLPPTLRRKQPAVHMILTTQGYTPWHHPQHGSHWLRLQPRGAWVYGEHDLNYNEQNRIFGWRKGLSTMNMDLENSGGQDFTMSSAIENHMTKEDLGPEASKQDWTDLKTLREELRGWEESISHLGHPAKESNRWSQVTPKTQDKKGSRPRHGKGKEVSCFHANTRVRMFTTVIGAPEYKRMDKLVKGDKLWTRRYRRNQLGPSQGHVSTVECVMTFDCPPEGQPMVEVEGNFLTPDHYVARGNGEWSTAGELTPPGTHIKYNKLSIISSYGEGTT